MIHANEEIGSNDELTESSSDEIKDLQKEYELKLQKIVEKKRLKKQKSLQILPTAQVPTSPQKKSSEVLSSPNKKPKHFVQSLVRNEMTPLKSSSVRPSNFVEKLYETGTKVDSINFENRIYEFKSFPKYTGEDFSELDTVSNERLRKRYVSKEVLRELLADMKILRVEKLLAKVYHPHYSEPNYENWVFVGFISNKSDPQLTKDKKKFIKLTVGNFNQSVNVMLFDKAFKKYWKLSVGNLIVILNPQINKYKPPFKGFNLKIDEDLNSIIEVGSIESFGYCSAIKKDNKKCPTPINLKEKTLCAYHLDKHFKTSQNKRMELNGSIQLKSPKKNGVKQSMYLNKQGKGGFVNYDSINENTKVYGLDGDRLDSSKYHNPRILENIPQKRRKIANEKSNQILEKKLQSLSNNSTIKNLGLIKNPLSTANSQPQKVFTSNALNKIGFNPISTNSVYKSPTRKRKELANDLKELYDLSQSSSKTLETPSDAQMSKKMKWQNNIRNLKQYESKYTQNNSTIITNTEPTISYNQPIDIEDTAYDTDSDLDIAFDTQKAEDDYNKIFNRNM